MENLTVDELRAKLRGLTWRVFDNDASVTIDGILFLADEGNYLGQHFLVIGAEGKFIVMRRIISSKCDRAPIWKLVPSRLAQGISYLRSFVFDNWSENLKWDDLIILDEDKDEKTV